MKKYAILLISFLSVNSFASNWIYLSATENVSCSDSGMGGEFKVMTGKFGSRDTIFAKQFSLNSTILMNQCRAAIQHSKKNNKGLFMRIEDGYLMPEGNGFYQLESSREAAIPVVMPWSAN